MAVSNITSAWARWRTVGLALALLCVSLPFAARASELSIRGRVLDEQGKPVPGAQVLAACTGALPEGPKLDCGFPSMVGRKTTSDARGGFRLERLPAASYTLYAALEDTNQHITAEVMLPLQLRDSLDGMELRLKAKKAPTGAFSGLVVDTSGTPIEGVDVELEAEASVDSALLTGGRSRKALTDARGRFTFQNLDDVPYLLRVNKRGYIAPERPESVHAGQAPVKVALEPCAAVRGRAVGPDGSPVAHLRYGNRGLETRLPDGRFEEFYCGVRDGTEPLFELKAPGMATTRLTFKLQSARALDLGDVRMAAARVLKVRVTEKGSGQPLPHVHVEINEPLPRRLFGTDDDGKLEIDDHADVALELLVQANGLRPTQVRVAPGQTEVKVEMERGLRGVSGKALTGSGRPQVGRAVAICPNDARAEAPIDSEGEFRMPGGLTPGLCLVALQVYSPPLPTFEHQRYIWLDPQEPVRVEFRDPAERNPLHVRFEGKDTALRALLLLGDVPPQLDLKGMASYALTSSARMPETVGFRLGSSEEGGILFKNIGPGRYTLVAVTKKGAFRAPLTVEPGEQTLTVPIPRELTPVPIPKRYLR